jgi:hypothetical protein
MTESNQLSEQVRDSVKNVNSKSEVNGGNNIKPGSVNSTALSSTAGAASDFNQPFQIPANSISTIVEKGVLPPAGNVFPPWLLNTGFIFALILAFICLAASVWYLSYFLISTSNGVEAILSNSDAALNASQARFELAIQARTVMARLALLSCGTFVGMSLAFLGFALFLLGVKGEMDAEGTVESYSVKLARLSPGVFVMLCACILIGVCSTQRIRFDYERQTIPPANNNQGSAGNATSNHDYKPTLPDPGPPPDDLQK